MLGRKLKSAMIATAATGALLGGLAVSPASAVPLTFTWNPSLSLPALSTDGAFIANNIIVSDYANIVIADNGTATETGYLLFQTFQLNGGTVVTPGLNGTPAPDAYVLYLQFSATAHLNGWNPAAPTAGYFGAFDSVNYTFFGDPGGLDTFTIVGTTPTCTGCVGDVSLATGSLTAGVNNVSLEPTSALPSAHSTETFTPTPPGSGGFFVSPNPFVLNMEDSFTNTSEVSTLQTVACATSPDGTCLDVTINGGGGNINFLAVPVPEPGTLSLFGFGLLGLGFAFRRRSNA